VFRIASLQWQEFANDSLYRLLREGGPPRQPDRVRASRAHRRLHRL